MYLMLELLPLLPTKTAERLSEMLGQSGLFWNRGGAERREKEREGSVKGKGEER